MHQPHTGLEAIEGDSLGVAPGCPRGPFILPLAYLIPTRNVMATLRVSRS